MANPLLDFVMSLVRDPDVAARYAADPLHTLAAADLPGVTTLDVDHLIPVVAESIPAAVPAIGTDWGGGGTDWDGAGTNVWASGAATAAFDSFDVPVRPSGVDLPGGIDDPGLPTGLPTAALDAVPVVEDYSAPLYEDFADLADLPDPGDAVSHAGDSVVTHPDADHGVAIDHDDPSWDL